MKRLYAIALITVGSVAFSGCEWADSEGKAESHPMLQASNDTTEVVFTGMEDHSISLDYAREMIAAFREENPDVEYGWYFGREAIEKILAQTGAVGLRIYGGLKEDGTFRPVLFGVFADGNDIDGIKLNKALKDSVIILEFPAPCPPFCCTDC